MRRGPQVAATVLVLGLVSLPGAALGTDPTRTVSVGGSVTAGTHPISVTSSGSVLMSVQPSSGVPVNHSCSAASFSGAVRSGSSAEPVATFTRWTWTGCQAPGGSVAVVPSGSWTVSPTGTPLAGRDRWEGQLRSFSTQWSWASNPTLCRFTISGDLPVQLDERPASAQQLVLNVSAASRRLLVSSVVGCAGRYRVGDAASLAMSMNITSRDGAIDVS